MRVSKALIPAAGLGTRFYPFTKAVPKELLPILSTPIIDFILEEISEAGIKNVVSVVSDVKKSFSDHVREMTLLQERANPFFVKQDKPEGLGHAVWCARGCFEKDELISILLPDNIFIGPGKKLACPLKKMLELSEKHDASIIAVKEIDERKSDQYGIVSFFEELETGVFSLNGVVEKPCESKAPSNLAIVGRYVLHSDIFRFLENAKSGFGHEIQLTDAIQGLMDAGHKVLAYKVRSRFLDVGTPSGWLDAILAFALEDEKLRKVVMDNVVRDVWVKKGEVISYRI
ncbi:UTP--glucose-1-phosphate uridylyltransferase [Candidatus Dependentiae bacterium]